MKVALYTRVSTDEQALKQNSIPAQLCELREYSKKHNYSIVGEYSDEGYSGGLLNRPDLNKLLDDVKQNKIDLIIFVKLDRWFRSVAHYYKIQEILEQHNVNWVATQEDYETITSSGKFKVNIMLSVSQQFKEATSERIKSVFEYKVKVKKEVIHGTKIYGYDIVNKKYVINEKEANNVKLLFNKYIEYGSLNRTYKWWLNIKDELMETMRERLKNIKYNGKYKYKEVIYNDFIPKIIDDELFNKVQNLLKVNYKVYTRSSYKHTYFFSGLLYCDCCNYRLSGYPYSSGNKAYFCPSKDKNKCNNKKFINELKIIDYIFKQLPFKVDEYNLKLQEEEKNNKKPTNINNLKNKYNRITNLFIDGLIDEQDNRYKSLSELKKQIDLLESQINEIKPLKKIEYNSTIKEIYNKLDDTNKQLFFKSIIERIVVKDGEIVDFYLTTK